MLCGRVSKPPVASSAPALELLCLQCQVLKVNMDDTATGILMFAEVFMSWVTVYGGLTVCMSQAGNTRCHVIIVVDV